MTRAFLFPGQGSQVVGMGKDLAEAFSVARAVFDEVDAALSQNLSRLMWDGPEADLTLTENAQPALMATSLAVSRVIEAETGKRLSDLGVAVAGHSLGEYSALAAVGALTIADTARLLKRRGQAMQKAVPLGTGAMAALLGVELSVAQEIADAAAEGEVCDIANDNGGGQIVLSGTAGAIARAVAVAPTRGVKRALPLPVSAPFHCRLMQPAADTMAEALASVPFVAPSLPVVINVAARPEQDPAKLRASLVEQVTGRVRWSESIMYMANSMGIREFVELGSGKVLTGLVKRIAKDATGSAVNGPADVAAFLKTL